jgi:hypothetical protein
MRNGLKDKDRQNGGEYRKIGVSSQHRQVFAKGDDFTRRL